MASEKFNARTRRAPLYRGLASWSGAFLTIVLAAIFSSAAAFAQAPAPIISKILITGNQRVEDDAIRIHISQQVGQPLDRDALDADIKTIYKMGFFSDVETEIVQRGGATVLVYKVTERPQVSDVKMYGMKKIRSNDDKIVEAVKVHPGSILDPVAVKETINNITQVYADKGYTDAKVTFKAIPQPDNTAFAEFDVVEGGTVEITTINFEGNKAFSSSVLRSVMETKTHSKLLSWLTGWGALDQKKLQSDVDRLTAFYYDNGYLNVQVRQPRVTRVADKITLTVVVDEGTPITGSAKSRSRATSSSRATNCADRSR